MILWRMLQNQADVARRSSLIDITCELRLQLWPQLMIKLDENLLTYWRLNQHACFEVKIDKQYTILKHSDI